VYVTYELDQDLSGSVVMRGAKEVRLAGRVEGFGVGEFENAGGRKVYGVRIETTSGHELVELPANARNVTVHERALPEEFRNSLDLADPAA